MDLAPDFDEFIGSLIAHDVEFLIVGAYALAFHGAPRFTGDLALMSAISGVFWDDARRSRAQSTFGHVRGRRSAGVDGTPRNCVFTSSFSHRAAGADECTIRP